MSKPHLAVEEAEDVVVVDVLGDGLDGGPGGVLEHAVAEAVEGALVHLVDLVHVLLPDVTVQVHHERLHRLRHEQRVVRLHYLHSLFVLVTHGRHSDYYN